MKKRNPILCNYLPFATLQSHLEHTPDTYPQRIRKIFFKNL